MKLNLSEEEVDQLEQLLLFGVTHEIHYHYRHFDTYDDMFPMGCKYCPCFSFKGRNP